MAAAMTISNTITARSPAPIVTVDLASAAKDWSTALPSNGNASGGMAVRDEDSLDHAARGELEIGKIAVVGDLAISLE